MEDSTKTMMLTLASGVIKKGLMTLGATAVTHGLIASNQTETFVAAGMFLVGAGWSFWNDYGKAIVLSKLEVLKAQSMAQAAKLQNAGISAPTVTEIAAQHPTLTATEITKRTDAVVKVLIAAFVLSVLFLGSPASAQTTSRLTGNIVRDIAAAKPSASTDGETTTDKAMGSFGQEIRKITKQLVDKAIVDVQAALDDATKHNDAISIPCWQANLDLLKGLPSQWDNPPADIGIALGIQIQRDLLNSITGTDVKSLKVACAALWGDQLKIVANVGALLGVRIATGGLF